MEDKRRKQNISRSRRAQLQFSVSLVDHFLREGNFSQHLSASPSGFLAGVLESLTSNILDLTSKEAHSSGKKLIGSEHVSQALQNNEELHQFVKDDNKSVVEKTPEPDKN
ncbi:histone H2A-Bbd type 1-like [Peromyscus californicus insignis]|uniref:histone H2A-Bbd type 1-like n=1 Tax=Peromyscus californicus insignis TaxID=564181 RepID=UPI0022A6A980|nr:histone H2A-Bbd type 1-like [Peromyscus californicus insignis]